MRAECLAEDGRWDRRAGAPGPSSRLQGPDERHPVVAVLAADVLGSRTGLGRERHLGLTCPRTGTVDDDGAVRRVALPCIGPTAPHRLTARDALHENPLSRSDRGSSNGAIAVFTAQIRVIHHLSEPTANRQATRPECRLPPRGSAPPDRTCETSARAGSRSGEHRCHTSPTSVTAPRSPDECPAPAATSAEPFGAGQGSGLSGRLPAQGRRGSRQPPF